MRLLMVLAAVGLVAAAGLIAYVFVKPPGPALETGPGKPTSPFIPATTQGKKLAVELFFASPDGSGLVSEKRVIPRAEDDLSKASLIMAELKKGPRKKLSPLMPPEMEVRSLYLAEGTLVVDLQPEISGVAAGAFQEVLLWYSMVNSIIMNVHGINAVHFLVDGEEKDRILGHLDMRGAFKERLELVRWY
jgi:hypothetical protein